MASRKSNGSGKKATAARFVISNDKAPSVALRPGMKIDVQSVRLVDPQLRPAKKLGARLCGGSGTCIALVDVGPAPSRSSTRSRRAR